MRQVTEIKNIYTFEEASPELRDKIRECFHLCNAFDYILEERIESLKEFADYFGLELDYSLSLVPDRGEHISLKVISRRETLDLIRKSHELKDCPFTGVCYDEDLLEAFRDGEHSLDVLTDISHDYIERIHSEYDSLLSDDHLSEHCEANGYEFTENGELY